MYLLSCAVGYTYHYRSFSISKRFWNEYDILDNNLNFLFKKHFPSWFVAFQDFYYPYTTGPYLFLFLFLSFIFPTVYNANMPLLIGLFLYLVFFSFYMFINFVVYLHIFFYYGFYKNELKVNPDYLKILKFCTMIAQSTPVRCFFAISLATSFIMSVHTGHHLVFPRAPTPIDQLAQEAKPFIIDYYNPENQTLDYDGAVEDFNDLESYFNNLHTNYQEKISSFDGYDVSSLSNSEREALYRYIADKDRCSDIIQDIQKAKANLKFMKLQQDLDVAYKLSADKESAKPFSKE